MLLAGIGTGVHDVDADRTVDVGGPVTAIAAGDGIWAVVGDHGIVRSDGRERWSRVASIPGLAIRCLLPLGEEALAGTAEAHLYGIASGVAERVEAFEDVRGRDGWYTPWGGPPDTRSLAAAGDGTIFANVHVGGIPKSPDGGMTWRPTIDVDADVHEVVCHEDLVLAACAQGLAVSADGGESWRVDSEGLHGRYCRAVAATPEAILVSASTGPFTDRAAVYMRPLRSDAAFSKCGGGLPEWFGSNIDSHHLAADGERVALGGADGDVWVSYDHGESWELAAKGLPDLSGLVFAPPVG